MLDTKTKFKTFRNVKTKTLLETANSVDQNNEDNDGYDPETANNPIPIKVQESNDIEKWEEINIEFKESYFSNGKLNGAKEVSLQNSTDEGCYRMLHKMISNTLKHYKLDDVYDADEIMRIYDKNDMVNRFAKMATLDQDMRMLSSIIDFGEKPIHFLLNPDRKDDRLDGVKILDDGILIPKKRPTSAVKSTNGQCTAQKLSNQDKKRERIKELLHIPPRPSKRVEVVSTGECSSRFRVDLDVENSMRLSERNLSIADIEQTIQGANEILKPLKNKVAKYDKLLLLYIIVGLFWFGVVGFMFGFFIHYAISIVVGIIYFVILGIGVYFYKKTKNLTIESHFWLSLYLHSENLRHFLHNRVRLRPGFMAKWVEIYYLPLHPRKQNYSK